MIGWIFPFIFPFLSGGAGKLESDSANKCSSSVQLTVSTEGNRRTWGLSRVDSDETEVVYEAAGSLLQMLVTQLRQRTRCFVSGKSPPLHLPALHPGPFITGVDSATRDSLGQAALESPDTPPRQHVLKCAP